MRQNGSLRQLARELGLPPNFAATLSRALAGKGIGLASANRIRLALGEPAIGEVREPVCPDCGGSHRVGRCHGRPGEPVLLAPGARIVRRTPIRRWADLPVGELRRAIEERKPYGS